MPACNRIISVLLFIIVMFSNIFVLSAGTTSRGHLHTRQKEATHRASEHNLYLKYHFDIEKRNPTMWLIPSLYTIARGDHNYFGEIYGTIRNDTLGGTHINNLLKVSTIGSNSRTMPVMLDYINPKLYGKTIFADKILSPFHRSNRRLYRFRHGMNHNGTYTLYIRPKTRNPQLVWGSARIDASTGRIISCHLYGEYDMLKYEVDCVMNLADDTPARCMVTSKFSFLGNKITSRFDANYDFDAKELPDGTSKLKMMEYVRPDSLTADEKALYAMKQEKSNAHRAADNDSTAGRKSKPFQKKLWNIVNNYLIGSIGARGKNSMIRLSPIIDPTRLGYSNSKGVTYKISMSARTQLSDNGALLLTPQVGYSFKQNHIYVKAPLTWQIHDRHRQWVRIAYESGNRMSDARLSDTIKSRQYFYDHNIAFDGNTNIGRCLSLNVGVVYHNRTAADKAQLEALGRTTAYKSFAPSVLLTIDPLHKWPVMTVSYERSIKGMIDSNTEYERWEGDISYNKILDAGRQYNLRVGAGVYTNHSTEYFVDFRHFHDTYLNDSWDDDWTGRFQLIDSRWYNASKYYLKANATYESPLLLAARIPPAGKYIETERLYLNLLRIQHTRLYSEIGYGFKTRFVTIGIFTGLLNGEVHEFGTKFNLELFRTW